MVNLAHTKPKKPVRLLSETEFLRIFAIVLVLMLLTACGNMAERLESVGKEPPLSKVENPQVQPDYEPLTWPVPSPIPPTAQTANSLWQPGARTFFRDLRATQVGDIIRVTVSINDQATLNNESEQIRQTAEDAGAPALFGYEDEIVGKLLSNGADISDLLDIETDRRTFGNGSIARDEVVTTTVAAVVTQRLPNGNLVIQGTQEVRVNFEVRQVSISGVIRPQDIAPDNTIQSSMIAEARINYGGKGMLSELQQPRWGYQVIDAISPF